MFSSTAVTLANELIRTTAMLKIGRFSACVTSITLGAAVSEVAYKALLRSSGDRTKAGKPSFKVVKEIFF